MFIESQCPEKGCYVMTKIWAGARLQHLSEVDRDSACPKHFEKYDKIYQEHVTQCELYGIPI